MTQVPDTKPGNYYVTVVRDGGDYRPLLGPFHNDHAKALSLVDAAREKVQALDTRAFWYAYGTARIEDYDRPGLLNDYFNEGV